jgi:hypothetical protein
MLDIAWRTGLTLVALLSLMILAPNLSFGTAPYRLEEALGQTPQALVDQYLTEVAQGDLGAAQALWGGPRPPDGSLEATVAPVSADLGRYGQGMRYRVVDVSWWRTCCEPAAIDNPDTAGVATIRVAITDGEQRERIYIFETRVAGSSGGTPAGSSFRNWVITGAHPETRVSEVEVWR